jgi:hypothetical protein
MAQPRQIYASTVTRRERGWGRSRRGRAFVLSPLTRILPLVVGLVVLLDAVASRVL